MDFGLKHRSVMVQEAAAAILAATSRHVDCLEIVNRYASSFFKLFMFIIRPAR